MRRMKSAYLRYRLFHSLCTNMNVARRIAALKREIRYRKDELDRIEQMRAAGEPAVTTLPDFMSKYIVDIMTGIAEREAEIGRLERRGAERVEMLRKCLATLAGEADEQLHSLRAEGCNPPEDYIDELALDYDAIAGAARNMLREGELSPSACDCVEELDRYLASISGAQNAHLWTADALRSAQEWTFVRQRARHCLTLIIA